MDREKIEERDKRLLKSIRSAIKEKDKKPVRSKLFGKAYKFWLPILFAGVVLAGLRVYHQQPTSGPSSHLEPIAGESVENETPPIPETHSDLNDRIDAQDRVSAAAAIEEEKPYIIEKTVAPEKGALPSETASQPLEDAFHADHLDQKATAQSRLIQPGSNLPSKIRISQVVSCMRVSDRQYVAPRSLFSLKDDSKITIWMTVLSDKQPFTLTHAYYINGVKYCEVPLQITYPRMRTWSYVTLSDRNLAGRWRVEVIDDNGEKFEQIEFTVVP